MTKIIPTWTWINHNTIWDVQKKKKKNDASNETDMSAMNEFLAAFRTHMHTNQGYKYTWRNQTIMREEYYETKYMYVYIDQIVDDDDAFRRPPKTFWMQ